jgi:hypothetical protein
MKYSDNITFRRDVFTIELVYTKVDSANKTTDIQNIPLVNCTEDHFSENISEFNTLGLHHGLCANLSGVDIQGSTFNSIFSYITIRFNICNGNDCLSSTELEEIINSLKPRAFFFFLNARYTTKEPYINKLVNYMYVDLTYYDFKETQVFVSKSGLNIQDSYILDSVTSISNLVLDSYRDLVSVRSTDSYTTLNIHIQSSNNEIAMNLSYMKLSEMISSIGGFLNILLLFGNGISYYFGQYFFQIEFLDKIFNLINLTT